MDTTMRRKVNIVTGRSEDSIRELTDFELEEIREYEGYKPAPAVAADFRIHAERVRKIWDGLEV